MISRVELRVVMNRTRFVDEPIVVDTTCDVKFIFCRRYQAIVALAKHHIIPPVAPLLLPVPAPDDDEAGVVASGWARPADESSETAV